MAGQTFTTYINAKRTGSVDSEFAQLGAAGGKALTDLQRKAESASKALAGLTGGRGTGGQSPISQAYLTGFDQATAKAEKLEAAQARLARQNSTLVRALRTTGDTLQVVQGPLGPIAGRVTAAADALTRLTGVTLGLAGAGAALFAYARAANHFVEVRSKLAPLYDTQEQVNTALSKVYGIAQRARAGLEPIAELYGKLKLAADQYGYSQERVARTTELAAKSATLSGGPAVNRERGLYQFTQAIGTGKLQGQDLRALLEDTPFLGREISLGISKLPDFKGQSSGSIGDLRKLATEGKITADVIMRALDAAAGDIETRFSRLPPTLSSAFTSIGNSATMFAGRFEESTHVVTTLSRGIMLLGNNLNQIAALAGGVAAGFAAVAAAGQFKSISRDIGNALTSMRAQQTTARAGLEIAVNMRTATAQQTVALAEQEMQIRRNIVALEAEVGVQRELAANAEVGAAIGLPGAIAQKGSATLAGRQATKQLADEVEHLSMVQTQAATAGRKLEDQHKAVAVATVTASKSSSLLKTGLMSLLGAFNPVGIAVALATSVFLEWAFAESEAEKAAKKVEDAQRQLATVIDFTTGKVREQNAVLLANARLSASGGIVAADASHNAARAQILGLGEQITQSQSFTPGSTGGIAAAPTVSASQQAFLGALDRFRNGGSVQALQQFTENLAKTDPSMRSLSDQVTRLAGDAQTAARQVGTLQSSIKILNGTATAEDVRRAQGDFSGGKAQGEVASGRNLDAESEALAKKLSDEMFAAKYRENQQLADLEKRRSSLTADDYRDERAEIIATYEEAVRSFNERKDKEDAASQRAHERELKRIEEENQRRAERTTKRTDILGRYADEPKPDIKAEKDIRTLNALIGQTMNGLEEITKSNPLGQGLYTKEMADRDAENIANGLQKPFNDYLRQRERDVQISDLIVHGHDLEAEALKQVFDLHEKIGHVTMGQYEIILHNLQAEERTNDALAARDRILAPLRQAADDTRNSIISAIEAIENGGNPLSSGKNFLKGLFQQFNHASAVQLAEKITGGLDARVRDLLRGSTSVDSKIAEYLDALNQTSSGAEGLSSNLDKAAAAADHAANALQRVADVPAGGGDVGGDPAGSLYSLLGAKLPDSFYKPGTRIGGGVGDNIIYQAIGSLGAVITENLRPQSVQNALFAAGKTTARVSDHTTTDEAYDVRLPKGMSFAQATELVKKEASLFGVAVVKALNETTSGGTGPHAHYVFGQAAAPAATLQVNEGGGGAIGGDASGLIKSVSQLASMFLSAAPSLAGGTPTTVGPNGEIVVTARRSAAPTSVEAVYNKIGSDLGGKLDTLLSTKLFSKIGGKLGTAFQGAQTGEAVAGLANAIGIKLNQTGSAIGGAIGGVVGSIIPGVGTLIGSLIGSALGGIVGNLFTKPDFARENIKGSGGQIIATPGMDDHGEQQKQAASAMSDAFTQSLQKIADTLGATIGNFAVSVGVAKDGKYVVDPTGAGWISNRPGGPQVQEFATADEAVKAALADAISDGAIAGISAGARRLLASGKDIDTQLNKALQFQSVFKTLKQLKNPLGAAIDDLNTQFVGLISIFKEAGAAPDEWAQLKELYDLQRQQAITQNQGAGIGSQITDYIKNMLGGADSPLNKATVYQNSLAALNPLAADVNAGKAVDTDALLKAVGDFQSASQGLNGSSQSFFSDFDMLLALLNKAQSNLTGAAPGTPGAVAPSPFDDASMQALIGGTTGTIDAINNQTNVLSGLLTQIAGGGTAPANDYSAIDLLPTTSGTLAGTRITNPGFRVSAVA